LGWIVGQCGESFFVAPVWNRRNYGPPGAVFFESGQFEMIIPIRRTSGASG